MHREDAGAPYIKSAFLFYRISKLSMAADRQQQALNAGTPCMRRWTHILYGIVHAMISCYKFEYFLPSAMFGCHSKLAAVLVALNA